MSAQAEEKRFAAIRMTALAAIVLICLTMSGCNITLFDSEHPLTQAAVESITNAQQQIAQDNVSTSAVTLDTDTPPTEEVQSGAPVASEPEPEDVQPSEPIINIEQPVESAPTEPENNIALLDAESSTVPTSDNSYTISSSPSTGFIEGPSQTIAQYTPLGIASTCDTELTYAIYHAINAIRLEYGRPAAAWDGTGAYQSQQHSLYLAEGNEFVHSVKINWQWEACISYDGLVTAENAHSIAVSIVNASPSLLSTRCTSIGVGAAYGVNDGGVYIVVQGN